MARAQITVWPISQCLHTLDLARGYWAGAALLPFAPGGIWTSKRTGWEMVPALLLCCDCGLQHGDGEPFEPSVQRRWDGNARCNDCHAREMRGSE